MKPEKGETKRLKALLSGVKSISDVIGILGEPDSKRESVVRSEEDKLLYGAKEIKVELRYTRLSATLDLVVQELEDGAILLLQFPKEKPR
jgi:hypothetical protein